MLSTPVHALERLLTTLDVRLHAFAVCQVGAGARLIFDAMDNVVVHYVLAGSGTIAIPGHTPIPCGPGTMAFVPPRTAQALATAGDTHRDVAAGDHCRMDVDGLLRFDAAEGGTGSLSTICATLSATYAGSFGLFGTLTGLLVDEASRVPGIQDVFERLLIERARPDIGTHALTEALMKQGLILLVRTHLRERNSASPFAAALGDPRLGAAVAHVLGCPGQPTSLAELAAVAGMSRSAFARAFRDQFGQSPMDFVQKTRLHHGAGLLSDTGLPVKVIAAATGFASRSHFSRAFRSAFGVDPSAYREQHKGQGQDAPAKL